VKIRLLIAALVVTTAITSGVFFYGEQLPGQVPITIVGSVVVVVIAIVLIISSVRVPAEKTPPLS
jgi:hypothetical protein